jgi:hypothetical protein
MCKGEVACSLFLEASVTLVQVIREYGDELYYQRSLVP